MPPDESPSVSPAFDAGEPAETSREAHGMLGRLWALARQTRWVLVDQVFSSLSNFLLGLFVARAASPRQFGAFAIGLTVYQILVFTSRALVSDPLVIRFSVGTEEARRSATRSATGTALWVGLVGGVLLLGASRLTTDSVGDVLGVLALGLPFLLLQDCWRYAFFAWAKPKQAAINDLVWLASMVVAYVLLFSSDSATVRALLLAWVAAAALSAAIGALQARTLPRPETALQWLASHRDITTRLTTEILLEGGSAQAALFLVGVVSGLSALGSLKAALILFGPLYVVYQGAQAWAVPQGVRLRQASAARLPTAVRKAAIALGSLALMWGLLLMMLPDSAGTALLGQSWTGARPLILPLTVFGIAAGTIVGTEAALRALQAVNRTLHASVVAAPLIVTLTAMGAVLRGAQGAAIGWSVSNCILAAMLWLQFGRAYEAADAPAD